MFKPGNRTLRNISATFELDHGLSVRGSAEDAGRPHCCLVRVGREGEVVEHGSQDTRLLQL